MGTFRQIYRFFASLKLAVLSLLSLAAVLAVGTVLESMYGTRAAQVMVYQTWWFSGVLFFLALNVLCAATIRFPWKRHQLGFVVTHLGILVTLFGSFVTQQWGIDGNLPVVEKQTNKQILLPPLQLAIINEASNTLKAVPFKESGRANRGKLLTVQLTPQYRLHVDEFYPRSLQKKRTKPTNQTQLGEPYVRLELKSSRFKLEQEILSTQPNGPTELNLGPAVISFQKLWSKKEERSFLAKSPKQSRTKGDKGTIIISFAQREYHLSISELMQKWGPIGSTGHQVKVEKYYTHAIVQNNELINKSKQPINPAVRLAIRSTSGNVEYHTIFENFPEFPTLHRRVSGKNNLNPKFRMRGPKARKSLGMVGRKRGVLRLAQTADNKALLYKVFNASGELTSKGNLKVGEAIQTGWMDSTFKVVEWIPSSLQSVGPIEVDNIQGSSESFVGALHYRVEKTGRSPATHSSETESQQAIPQEGWLVQGNTRRILAGEQRFLLQLRKETIDLPFKIFLKQFRVGMDPGTNKAATYESDVVATTLEGRSLTSTTISMNEPLEYGGFTFYQASYQKEEGKPAVSIFSVNRDPGRGLKYAGSLLLCFGILIMFYMNPHYLSILFGRKKGS